jgi:hypothetical protein
MCVVSRRVFTEPGFRRLEVFMNRDLRYALSQELEAKQTLLGQLGLRLGAKAELDKLQVRKRSSKRRWRPTASRRRNTPSRKAW